MSHHIVEARDLAYTYPDGTPALRGVSFRITHGESVGLIGANGAGKSTLLLHLNGIFAPNEGTVRVGDYPITPKTLVHVRRAVGMVFQDPDDQLFMSSVREDVAFGPRNLDLPEGEIERRVQTALSLVGAEHLADRPPYRLSGGEKRAVAIATVLSMEPSILIMDEPSANLDPGARRKLIDLLRSFSHTLIVATHDLDMVADVCERTIVLKKGRIAADRPTMDILPDEDLLSSCGLEKPLGMQGCPICGTLGRPLPAPRKKDHDHHH